MQRAQGSQEAVSGAELARATRARLLRAAVAANGVGGLAVLVFGLITPAPFDPDDLLSAGILNGVTFLLFMAIAFPLATSRAKRIGAPIERWLAEERPATDAEREEVLRQPIRLVRLSAGVWGIAALVFTAVNATISPELAAGSGVITLLGGATCCALGYLLAERILRPIVALALAGGAPPRTLTPGIAGRLIITWTLVTGVPLVGIAAMATAEIAGTETNEVREAAAILFLAAVGFGVGLRSAVIAARSVADPVGTVRDSMARMEEGDFEVRVPVEDGSEVGQLQAGFNRMAAGLAERERLRDVFGRHVGRDVAHAALDGDLRLGGEVREVAVLFVDLTGSTALAARRPPTEVVDLLNAFFGIVIECVERQGGWVNKFEGDAALCIFGAPTTGEDPAGDALAAARELRGRLRRELPELDAGIGVSAGPAVAGNIGAEQRFEYTVIGDPVNEAARLCEMAKREEGRVLASDAALARAGEEERSRWAFGGEVTLRGRAEATRLATVAAR
jgi:adenylate cyclase